MISAEQEQAYIRTQTIPVLLDAEGRGMRRNFVHVTDLVDAIIKAIDNPKARQQTFNICMDEPLDYAKMGAHLSQTRGYSTARIQSDFYSTWMDNSKAKFLLDWRPAYDAERLIDSAFDYQRDESDPSIIWYPGLCNGQM
jgi:nucleoside-diphosphate-sugar epimerase